MYNKSEQFKLKKNYWHLETCRKGIIFSCYFKQTTSMVPMIVSQFDNWCWKKIVILELLLAATWQRAKKTPRPVPLYAHHITKSAVCKIGMTGML